MKGPLLVLTTVGRRTEALEIASALVQGRLAACVTVLPGATSTYRWKGAVETGSEQLLLIKTRGDRFPALERDLLARHPYEVPEILALEVAAGSKPYLEWLAEAAAPAPRLRPPRARAPGRRRGRRRPRSPR